MKAFPFQSNFVNMDEHGNPIYDRAVDADFFRWMWRLFFTNGVFANPSSNFQVLAHLGMTVRVKPGACFIQGATGIEENNTDLTIEKAEELTNRTDLIVLRVDFTQNRRLSVEVKKGTTELRRDADIWELQLAKIDVKALTQQIKQSDITDTRLKSDVCGVVTGTVQQVDTTEIFNQYMDYWSRKKAENEQAWQEQMQSQEQRFTAQQQTIEVWYQNVLADISTLQTFDFDNISELKGAKKTTTFLSDGNIEESIVLTGNNRKIATRKTEFLSDGKIRVNIKVYKENGTSILKENTAVTAFKNNGEIEEVVS